MGISVGNRTGMKWMRAEKMARVWQQSANWRCHFPVSWFHSTMMNSPMRRNTFHGIGCISGRSRTTSGSFSYHQVTGRCHTRIWRRFEWSRWTSKPCDIFCIAAVRGRLAGHDRSTKNRSFLYRASRISGWDAINKKFFADGAAFDQIQSKIKRWQVSGMRARISLICRISAKVCKRLDSWFLHSLNH